MTTNVILLRVGMVKLCSPYRAAHPTWLVFMFNGHEVDPPVFGGSNFLVGILIFRRWLSCFCQLCRFDPLIPLILSGCLCYHMIFKSNVTPVQLVISVTVNPDTPLIDTPDGSSQLLSLQQLHNFFHNC